MSDLSSLPWRSRVPLPHLEKGEKFLRRTGGHWIQYVIPIFVATLLLGTGVSLFVAAANVASSSASAAALLHAAGLVVSLGIIHWLFHFGLSEEISEIVLTNKRLMNFRHRLWLFDAVDETVLARVKVVEVRERGVIHRLLDYGDLWLDTSGGKTLHFVPHPKEWVDDIQTQIG